MPRRAAAVLAAAPLVVMMTGCAHDTVRRSMTSTLISGATGYAPINVVANKEDTMIIKIGNGTDRVHGFSIEGYQVEKTVDPNQTVEVKFRLGRAGQFKIYCQLHPAHQTATLFVR